MNAFLIFCKRHRSMVREKHPDRDNRSVTRILGDLWANLAEDEKLVYTNLAKQYKDAFMKAHPDYKWHSSEKVSQPAKMATRPTNARPPRSLSTSDFPTEGGIMPGQLAADWANRSSANDWHLQALTNPSPNPAQSSKPPPVNQASATYTSQSETGFKRQDGEQKPETNPNPAYFFSSKPEFQQLNQKPSSLVPVPEEKKPAEDVPHGASADVSIPPKKKFTKLQETCKAEKSTASESSAEPQAGCLSDQNDNAIFTCGKLVVNHIIDRLFSANFCQRPECSSRQFVSCGHRKGSQDPDSGHN
nr:hypothetical protein BaRGS_011130 [Batillaria attramentaria]